LPKRLSGESDASVHMAEGEESESNLLRLQPTKKALQLIMSGDPGI
jgi:hypothetical protein